MYSFLTTAALALLGLFSGFPDVQEPAEPQSRGLYRTAQDFRQGRLSLAVDCKTNRNQLRLHEIGPRPYVTAVKEGEEYKLAKAQLFGYRDCDGRVYRFVNSNEHYPILNPGEELLLYRTSLPAVGHNPGYVRLYFSAAAEAPVQPLTLRNLKQAFPDNHDWHDRLDAQFPAGSDLAAFDNFHGMTKVNWLLQRSQVLADAL